uniref:Flagellin n=1 Tax=Ignisphaera aggregans TaxID=334771 RepID=A0A7J2U2W2_9CREN
MKWVSGVHTLAKQGQAEVIGGIIAITVLIFSIAAIYFLTASTQYTASTEYSRRTSFEAERSAEKLTVSYDPSSGSCIIANTGPIGIKVARIWINNTFLDPQNTNIPQTIPAGYSIAIPLSSSPDYIVTSRGNVFSVKGDCIKLALLIPSNIALLQYGVGPFTSQNIVATTRMLSNVACINISVSNTAKPILMYMLKNGTWLWHSCKIGNTATYGWKKAAVQQLKYSVDVDSNGVREAITFNASSVPSPVPIKVSKNSNVTIRLLFYNLTTIPQLADVVTVYYKFVVNVSGSSTPKDVLFTVYAALRSLDNTKIFSSSGQTQVAGIAKPGDNSIAIVTGYVPFPKFFYNFTSGFYSIELALTISTPTGKIDVDQIDLEYLAVVGAQVNWPPLPKD